jgi:hypothetical protein
MKPTRRSEYEIVIDPALSRTQVRRRTAVTALFAPDWKSAAELLLQTMKEDGAL